MKFIKYFRNHLVIILCGTIVCMGLGFIVLSLTLKNEKNSIPVFDVSFVNIEKESAVKGSDLEPIVKADILDGGKKIDMDFVLNAVHDEITYVATIKNKGTLPAEIVDIFESPDYSNSAFQNMITPVSISLSNIRGKIVPAGEVMKLKIVVYYPPSNMVIQKKAFHYSIGLVTKSR